MCHNIVGQFNLKGNVRIEQNDITSTSSRFKVRPPGPSNIGSIWLLNQNWCKMKDTKMLSTVELMGRWKFHSICLSIWNCIFFGGRGGGLKWSWGVGGQRFPCCRSAFNFALFFLITVNQTRLEMPSQLPAINDNTSIWTLKYPAIHGIDPTRKYNPGKTLWTSLILLWTVKMVTPHRNNYWLVWVLLFPKYCLLYNCHAVIM